MPQPLAIAHAIHPRHSRGLRENAMTYSTILFDLADGVATLTLNRPDKLNSFTAEMHGEIRDVLGKIAVPASGARVLQITGAGRGFCAGQDLSQRKGMSA